MRGEILMAFAEMMPEIRAEESLAAAELTGVAMGTFDEETRRDIVARWRGELAVSKPAPQPKAERPDLSALGIAVVTTRGE